MNNTKRPALGRGLGALIPGAQSQSAPTPIRRDYFECAIEDVHPTADNPRQRFDEQKLNELAESIRLRLPYIDPLNALQVEMLARHRGGEGDELVRQSIHLSINGISAGLRNSG